MDPTPLLHIHAQRHPHDEASIVGSRLGLLRLHAALCQALDWGKPSTAEAMVNDGEGYEVIVQLDSEPWDPAHPWGHRALPYTSPDIQQYSPEPRRPWEEWHARD